MALTLFLSISLWGLVPHCTLGPSCALCCSVLSKDSMSMKSSDRQAGDGQGWAHKTTDPATRRSLSLKHVNVALLILATHVEAHKP